MTFLPITVPTTRTEDIYETVITKSKKKDYKLQNNKPE